MIVNNIIKCPNCHCDNIILQYKAPDNKLCVYKCNNPKCGEYFSVKLEEENDYKNE